MLYFAQLYTKYAEQRKLNLYSSALQKIPTPRFVVFYNGMKDEPDRQILKLSNAFQTEGGCLECEAAMLNINVGRNPELLKKCRRLEEYAIFVDAVRKHARNDKLELGEAISVSIEECMGKGILSDILTVQRAEVFAVLLETFDKELYERDLEENLRAKIREEITEELKIELIRKKLQKGKKVEQIAEEIEEEVENVQALIDQLS